MLKNQIAKSNNGVARSKYITFGITRRGRGRRPAPAGACGVRCDGQLQVAGGVLRLMEEGGYEGKGPA